MPNFSTKARATSNATTFSTITLAAGALTDANGAAVNITGNVATLTAPGGIDTDTDVNTLVASSTNTAITVDEANGLALGAVNAGTGNVTITLAAGAITDANAGAVNITGNVVTLTAPAGIDTDLAATTLAANTSGGNGDILIDETSGLALLAVNAGTGNVTITLAAGALTDANGAIFDARHGFAGCIPGIHEVLRRQGLLRGTWCLDPKLGLSPGQAAEITRVIRSYPGLTDDEFVRSNLDRWLA